MDYEKKYKEALERAKEKYAMFEGMKQGDVLEDIFPELKESGGERIRKELTEFLKSASGGFLNTTIQCKTFGKWAAWLENQGESDETKAKMFLINKGYPIDANGILPTYEEMYNIIREGLEKQGEQKPQGKSALEGINEIKVDNANKVEPKDYSSIDPHFGKPVDFKAEHFYVSKVDGKIHDMTYNSADKVEPKFKIGDIIRFKGNEILKGEAETHKIVSYDNELYVFADGTTDLFCEQDLYELVEQNAWSEEDEDYINDLIKYFSQNERLKNTKEDIVIWLKSIKPQPKNEWSEEDEKMIEAALQFAHEYGRHGLWCWLKSLKPQNRWKPSDEQMVAVQEAMNIVGILTITGSKINSLYQDLKKLKEE